MNLTFKIMQEDDIKAVEKIINKAYRGEISGNAWTSEGDILAGIRVNEDMLKEILKDKSILTYLALLDDKIVATIQTKLENNDIHIGLFAVDPNFQAYGVGKKLLEYAENSASQFWNKNNFVMEVISNRLELKEYYIRRGYKDTKELIDFPKSSHWSPLVDEDLKLLILRKTV